MRIRVIALACALLCGCSSASTTSAVQPVRAAAGISVTSADINACRDFRSWYGQAKADLTNQGKMAALILANGDGATGQLGWDVSALVTAVLTVRGARLVSADAGQVRRDCLQVDASQPAPAASLPPPGDGAANARRIVYALASGNPATIAALTSAVAGRVMLAYVHGQAIAQQAYAQDGEAGSPGAVTAINGGYQACYSASSCQTYTAFTFSKTGRVTGLSVDGLPVSGRLTIGAKAAHAGLVISDVTGYLYTGMGELGVIFTVRDAGPQTYSGNAPFLPVFITFGGSRYEYDALNSRLPSGLRPGQVAAGIAFFHTTAIAGRFSLRTNTQPETVIVYTHLLKP